MRALTISTRRPRRTGVAISVRCRSAKYSTECFPLYRGHFWFFAGLSAASAGVSAGLGILRLVYMHYSGSALTSASHVVIVGGIGILQAALYLVAYSLTIAATTFEVNAFYLGQPTSLGVALTAARHIWMRCLGISIWQSWSAMWTFTLLLLPILLNPGLRGSVGSVAIGIFFFIGFATALVYGVIAYLRNSLALPAAVVENLLVRAAMRRASGLQRAASDASSCYC